MSVPVTVVTGFLGAGKTTLVNHWLAQLPRGEVAVIVNEHGDVGIDGELLAGRARTLREITGGCICCRTQAELVRALDELAGSAAKRIVVETSGAASPAAVLRTIAGGGRNDAFALDGVITVLDATRVDAVAEHELAIEQLGYADVVVLSRVEVGTREVVDRARDFVAERNAAAIIVESARGEGASSLDDVLSKRSGDLAMRTARSTAAAHEYESVSLVLDGEVDGERFAEFMETDLAQVAGRIFRVKGILAVAGMAERMIVQGVADLVEVSFGDPWEDAARRSRLVVVGFGLDRAALERAFASTRLAR